MSGDELTHLNSPFSCDLTLCQNFVIILKSRYMPYFGFPDIYLTPSCQISPILSPVTELM